MSSDVTIVLKAVDMASGTLNKMSGGTKSLTNNLLAMAKAAGVVTLAYKGFDYLKTAVNDTVAYAEEVRDLSRALGINAEESSKLIQLGDDLKIDLRQMQMAFRFALNKGVDPSIDGLKKLAVEYQAIPDPIEKAQFAMEKFGTRGGLQMQKVLELSSEAIDDMAQSAEDAGLVMSDDAVKAAREYEIAIDNLEDTVQGLTYTIGQDLIPVLSEAATGLGEYLTEAKSVEKTEKMLDAAVKAGIITRQEYIKIMGDAANRVMDLNRVNQIADDTELALRDTRRESIAALNEATGSTDALTDATDELSEAEGANTAVLDMAIEAIKNSNVGMSTKIELEKELKLLTGEITEKELALEEALGYLTKQLELGNLSMDEYIALVQELNKEGADAKSIISQVGIAIEQLPEGKEITIGVTYKMRNKAPYGVEDPDAPVIIPPEKEKEKDGKLQFGGSAIGGRPYIVGERGPELFVPNGSGQVVNNWNLTINEAGSRGNVVMDFEIMKALARA